MVKCKNFIVKKYVETVFIYEFKGKQFKILTYGE